MWSRIHNCISLSILIKKRANDLSINNSNPVMKLLWPPYLFIPVIGCMSPFLPGRLKVEIKRMYEIADHALAPPPFFGQTVNPISTKGNCTPNLMFWKWMHILKILLIENLECTSVRPVGAEHRSIVDSSVNRVLLCSSCFPNSHTDRGDTMPCNNNSCCFFSPNVWTSSKIGRMNSNRFVKWCGLRFWFCK